MDNNQKILVAGIIIILIILVGAFALSGSNNATPTITPTATPVITVTPTPIPSSGSTGASTPTPTAVVSATPTPTPSVTATPVPDSGVKQTEFGYWITYPPLGPENWSAPNPQVNAGLPNNTVYFSPTSASVNVGYSSPDADYASTADATIYRNGDLTGTTNVIVHMVPDGNVWFDDESDDALIANPFGTWYDLSDNAQIINQTYFSVTFAPGESSQDITIYLYGLQYLHPLSVNTMAESSLGSVKMTIVGVDDGYTYGYNNQYTLNVYDELQVGNTVEFATANAWFNNQSGCQVESSDGPNYNVSFGLTRSNSAGTLTPVVDVASTNIFGDDQVYILKVDPFQPGSTTTRAYLHYTLQEDNSNPYASLEIYDPGSNSYTVGTPNLLHMYLYYDS